VTVEIRQYIHRQLGKCISAVYQQHDGKHHHKQAVAQRKLNQLIEHVKLMN